MRRVHHGNRQVRLSSKLTGLAIKVAITLAAFFLLARRLDLETLWARLTAISAPMFAAALATGVVQISLVGLRWASIVRAMSRDQQRPPLRVFQQIIFGAQFVGQVMPSLAGDGLRMLMLRETGVSLGVAIKSTVLDRGFALIALFAIAVPGLLFSSIARHHGALRQPLLYVAIAALLAFLAALALARPIARALSAHPLLEKASTLLLDMRAVATAGRSFFSILALCLVIHGLSVLMFMLLARGQGLYFAWLDGVVVVAVMLIVTAIPVSFAGWGVREVAVVTLLRTLGVQPESAVALSISFGIVLLLASLPGSVVLLGSLISTRTEK